MKKILFLILITFSFFPAAFAEFKWPQQTLAEQIGFPIDQYPEACDTIVEFNGYKVSLVKTDGKIRRIGLNLFPEELKKKSDRRLLNFIETNLLAMVNGYDVDSENKIILNSGKLEDFIEINPETELSLNFENTRNMNVEWILPDDRTVQITLPLTYTLTTSADATRGEIEDRFIEEIKTGLIERVDFPGINTENLKDYTENMKILPGKYYLNREVNRNVYLNSDEELSPVWTPLYPLESIANLFIYPSDEYGTQELDLKVVKHEYGKQTNLKTAVNSLLAAAESEGCLPYWGVESFKDGKLEGALILYNENMGYVHVLKIDCMPEEILDGEGELEARASLYIPVNNISNLFQEFVKKEATIKL